MTAVVDDNECAAAGSFLLSNPGFRLSRLAARLRTGFADLLRRWDLRPSHQGVLAALAVIGPTSQRGLAAYAGLDDGNLVGLIDDLDRSGLLRRRRDPADRRRHLVELTDDGRRVVTEIAAATSTYLDRWFAALPASERDGFAAALETLSQSAFGDQVPLS